MYERFTDRARRVPNRASKEAWELRDLAVEPEHLLLALLYDESSIPYSVLKKLSVNYPAVRAHVVDSAKPSRVNTDYGMPLSSKTRKVLKLSWRISREHGLDFVGPEQLLIALIHDGKNSACQILESFGVDLIDLKSRTIRIMSWRNGKVAPKNLHKKGVSDVRIVVNGDDIELHETFKTALLYAVNSAGGNALRMSNFQNW